MYVAYFSLLAHSTLNLLRRRQKTKQILAHHAEAIRQDQRLRQADHPAPSDTAAAHAVVADIGEQ